MKKSTKYIGFASLVLGVTYFIKSSAENESLNIDGLNVELNPEVLIENGIEKLNLHNNDKEVLKRLSKRAIGRYIGGNNG